MPRQWQPCSVFAKHCLALSQVTINVYFHVISTGPNLGDGNVPDQWVAAQINTMNKAYIATGFQVRNGLLVEIGLCCIHPTTACWCLAHPCWVSAFSIDDDWAGAVQTSTVM